MYSKCIQCGGGGDSIICLTIFDDMLVINIIDKILHVTQYTYQLIAF